MKNLKKVAKKLEQFGLFSESAELLSLLKIAQSTVYVIKAGDTISRIAGGDPQYIKLIKDANPGLDPSKLQIGQKINLPPKPNYPNKTRNHSSSLVEFLKRYEGNRGRPHYTVYDDGFGNKTIGWGHKLRPGETYSKINDSIAESLLKKDLKEAVSFVQRNVSHPLNQNQFDALVSLVFNAGGSAVYKTDLFKAIDSGNIDLAYRLFPTTLIGANQGGLQPRRREEAEMFRGGVGTY